MSDPIRFEVVRNALTAVTEEMALALRRSAYSTNIRTRQDFSCAFFDRELRVIAQAFTQPVHLGSMVQLVPRAVRAYGPERLELGDVLVTNDPYGGGVHLNDITMIAPAFAGNDLFGYVANLAHHADVGGGAPASIGAFREVFQEGVIIPVVKIVAKGTIVDDVFRLILAQIRSKRETTGDLRAQVAANVTGTRRVGELLDRFGLAEVRADVDALVEYTRRRARHELAKLPPGSYEATGFVDNDGFTDRPVRLQAAVTLSAEKVIFDLTGSDPQRRAPVNSTIAQTFSACAYAVKCLIDGDVPVNQGFYDLIQVDAPLGTVTNCKPPAPVVGGWETQTRLVDVIFKALAPAMSDGALAGTKAMMAQVGFGGMDPKRSEYYCFYEALAGGYGARKEKDGPDAVQTHGQNTENAPIEEIEANYPVRIARYELVPGSEGPGRRRGGLGLRRDYLFPDHGPTFTILSDRDRAGPWGIHGGQPGHVAEYILNPDAKAQHLGSKTTVELEPGDVVSFRTCGGGGYGSPFDREPDLVLADVRNGKVSLDRARTVYGVAIDPRTWTIDLEETRRPHPHPLPAGEGEGEGVPCRPGYQTWRILLVLHEPSPLCSPPVHEVRFLHDVKVPVRDGIRLSADIFLPRGGGSFPTIVLRTPYESNSDRHLKWGLWWARRGYAAVIQDCRGCYQSEGTFRAYLDDGPDTFDLLEWIANQPWCNGKIGTWGRSYGGLYQWLVAPLGSPHLTCMAPHVFPENYFDDCHYPGGAFQLALSALAAIIWVTNYATITNSADVFFSRRYARHLPLIDLDVEAIGRKIPFYREWLDHQTDDEYWKALSMRGRYRDISVPIFQQAGWYDPYADAQLRLWNGMTEEGKTSLARANQRILIGPWGHNPPESSRFGEVDFGSTAFVSLLDPELRWFDHWLKGIDTGFLDEPPIELFVMGENVWRSEREWPLARTQLTAYYLHSQGRANSLEGDGTLDQDSPGAEEPDRFAYDPEDPVPSIGGNSSIGHWAGNAADPVVSGPIDRRPIERRADVLVYTSAVLERDLEVTGPIEVVLYAASSARDTDFVVKLIDVFPDGWAMNLSDGIVRARYRKSLETTELLEPGEVAEYRIKMCVTSNLFKKGHRIRLDLTSSNFPRFSRNLNTGEDVATGTRMAVARQTVLHSSRYPSRVVLPVIPR